MRLYILHLLLFANTLLNGQKAVHIPLYLQDTQTVDGAQFSWDKTAESDNFILIWGDSVGTDPATFPDPSLRFDPVAVLDTLEWIYQQFKDLGFADEYDGSNLSQYKIPVVIYGTWGHAGAQGFANGGDADGVIGAFWVHPLAMKTGHVTAHELTHSLQAQHNIDIRKANDLGLVWLHAGIFWETHANFMRNLLYPEAVSAWGMDLYHIETWGDWKNTYENYPLLMALMEEDGIGIINRMWREADSFEYPLQAYKRLSGYDQSTFNDKVFRYARRMAAYDFSYNNLGTYFRQYRASDLMYHLPSTQCTYTILHQDTLDPHHFHVPIELAPEEYGYSVIPLYPHPDSCAIIVRFKGHTETNAHAGWRYGFVAAGPDGKVSRYSDIYSASDLEISFAPESGETEFYLVVMGAPHDMITTTHDNDTWHGYPKHFRFPYDINISGAQPEGYQEAASFRSQIKTNGHLHSNGGGWVENSATVDESVYVGPHAIVLGNSQISGNVRIENTAILRDATAQDDVVIRDNALVIGGHLSGHAVIAGQALAENCTISDQALVHMRARVSNYRLHGDIEVGGDVIVYNLTGDCDNGVYYRMTNYYQDNLLECDGRTADHPANADVNEELIPFASKDVRIQCHCALLPDCLQVGTASPEVHTNGLSIFPNPASNMLHIRSTTAGIKKAHLYDLSGRLIDVHTWSGSDTAFDVTTCQAGVYTLMVFDAAGMIGIEKVVIQHQ